MKLIRLHDLSKALQVITDPEIWERIKEDGQEKPIELSNKTGDWFGLEIYGNTIGIALFIKLNSVLCEVHFCILKQYRRKYANKAVDLVIKHFAYDTVFNKMVTNIMGIYKPIRNFAVKHGFQVEGINRQSVLKNGKYLDQWLVGITKQEAINYLKEATCQ